MLVAVVETLRHIETGIGRVMTDGRALGRSPTTLTRDGCGNEYCKEQQNDKVTSLFHLELINALSGCKGKHSF
jgi:hypothetical protein